MDVNEKICIERYNPQWPGYFEQEKIRIQKAVSNQKLHIEHIGSTSVKGMSAKPIIDILIGIELFPPDVSLIQVLENSGYEYMKMASVKERLYFVKRAATSFNVHIVAFQKKYGMRISDSGIISERTRTR